MWQSLFSGAAPSIAQKIDYSKILNDPFEHVIIQDLFPVDVYQLLIDNPIPNEYLHTLGELKRTNANSYPNRHVIPLSGHMPILPSQYRAVWQEVYSIIVNIVAPGLVNRFASVLLERFCNLPELHMDVLYVRDCQGYNLGPHTDSTIKVCTFLIYLAAPGVSGPGTSFYRPLDSKFRCAGGPHYTKNQFELVSTAPYRANTLVSFAKSNRSFHGVELMVDNVTRNLLICDIQIKQ